MAFLQDLKKVLFDFKSKRTAVQAVLFFAEYTFFLLVINVLVIPFLLSFKNQLILILALIIIRVVYSSIISITIFVKKKNYCAGSIITLLFAVFSPIVLGIILCMIPASILTIFEAKEQ